MSENIYELSKEFQSGLVDLYKDSGFDALCREMSERIEKHKGAILAAWFAEHGFAPGKAVLVEERSGTEFRTYIRECTAEEAERAKATANRQIVPRDECHNAPDVPLQYKQLVDDMTTTLAHYGDMVWGVVTELGCNSFECEGKRVKVRITSASE